MSNTSIISTDNMTLYVRWDFTTSAICKTGPPVQFIRYTDEGQHITRVTDDCCKLKLNFSQLAELATQLGVWTGSREH